MDFLDTDELLEDTCFPDDAEDWLNHDWPQNTNSVSEFLNIATNEIESFENNIPLNVAKSQAPMSARSLLQDTTPPLSLCSVDVASDKSQSSSYNELTIADDGSAYTELNIRKEQIFDDDFNEIELKSKQQQMKKTLQNIKKRIHYALNNVEFPGDTHTVLKIGDGIKGKCRGLHASADNFLNSHSAESIGDDLFRLSAPSLTEKLTSNDDAKIATPKSQTRLRGLSRPEGVSGLPRLISQKKSLTALELKQVESNTGVMVNAKKSFTKMDKNEVDLYAKPSSCTQIPTTVNEENFPKGNSKKLNANLMLPSRKQPPKSPAAVVNETKSSIAGKNICKSGSFSSVREMQLKKMIEPNSSKTDLKEKQGITAIFEPRAAVLRNPSKQSALPRPINFVQH